MPRSPRALAATVMLVGALFAAEPTWSQKYGGALKLYTLDSPASMSIHEETTVFAQRPMMGVFNNLVMFDQHVKQNSLQSIVPELVTGWSWNGDRTELTFALRQGVKWHDGEPFTAKDVQCTWDMLTGKSSEKLRINPRKAWYRNLEEVTTNGDYEVTFHLKRPQPSFIVLLASGFSAIYPCHVSLREMRQHPIGTGPYKFVEFRPNEVIRVTKNPDYWKRDRPYLDGVSSRHSGEAYATGPARLAPPLFVFVSALAAGPQQRECTRGAAPAAVRVALVARDSPDRRLHARRY